MMTYGRKILSCVFTYVPIVRPWNLDKGYADYEMLVLHAEFISQSRD